MRLVMDFINNHSQSDLIILAFFVTVGSTVTGWILDLVIHNRGFGVIGNGLLIFLGGLTGLIVAQTLGPMQTIPEIHRIVLFSSSSAALMLVFFCLIKSWRSTT